MLARRWKLDTKATNFARGVGHGFWTIELGAAVRGNGRPRVGSLVRSECGSAPGAAVAGVLGRLLSGHLRTVKAAGLFHFSTERATSYRPCDVEAEPPHRGGKRGGYLAGWRDGPAEDKVPTRIARGRSENRDLRGTTLWLEGQTTCNHLAVAFAPPRGEYEEVRGVELAGSRN